MTPTKTDLAWAAGFFDGEGCVAVGRNKKNNSQKPWWFHVSVALVCTNKPAIEKFLNIAEIGSLNKRKRTKTNKLTWAWRASLTNSKEFLEKLLPYLIIKKEEVKLAIKLSNSMKRGGNYRSYTNKERKERIKLSKQISLLKKREWK
jgi:hypothetical protein